MAETDYSKDSQIYIFNEKLKEIGFFSCIKESIKDRFIEFYISKETKHFLFEITIYYPFVTEFEHLLDGCDINLIGPSNYIGPGNYISPVNDVYDATIQVIIRESYYLRKRMLKEFYKSGIACPKKHFFLRQLSSIS